jgi:putative tryptophan/tyrosine transport system substrate-binding protein
VDLAAKNRLPVVYSQRQFVDAGGLMSDRTLPLCFGAPAPTSTRSKGAEPEHLPIEQPTKFELIINVRTGKTLGVTIPPSLLLRADQVIE